MALPVVTLPQYQGCLGANFRWKYFWEKNLMWQGLTNQCIYWRPVFRVWMLLEPLNPKFHSGFATLCLHPTRPLKSSLDCQTNLTHLCSPNSNIDLVRRDPIYNLILYSSKFVFSLKSCFLFYLINSERIQLLLVIRFEWTQSFCVLKYLWNKVLSRQLWIYLAPSDFYCAPGCQLWCKRSKLSRKFLRGGGGRGGCCLSYPVEILHEPFHLRPALMWPIWSSWWLMWVDLILITMGVHEKSLFCTGTSDIAIFDVKIIQESCNTDYYN